MKALRAAIAGVVLFASSFAFAQTSDSAQKEAETRYAEGRTLYAAGKIDEARLKFTQAYAVLHSPETLWDLAVAETYSKHPVDAIRHFREYGRTRGADAAQVAKARDKYIPELEKQTSRIKIEGDALKVTIDDEQVPDAERALRDVTPGLHLVAITTAQGVNKQQAACALGETFVITVPAAPPGSENPPASASPEATGPSTAKILTTVGLAVAGAGFIVGGVAFAADSNSKADAADTLRGSNPCQNPSSPACSDLQSKVDASNSSKTLATVFYIVGGVSLAGAVATWFLWPNRTAETKTGTWLTPSFGRGSAGFDFGGRF